MGQTPSSNSQTHDENIDTLIDEDRDEQLFREEDDERDRLVREEDDERVLRYEMEDMCLRDENEEEFESIVEEKEVSVTDDEVTDDECKDIESPTTIVTKGDAIEKYLKDHKIWVRNLVQTIKDIEDYTGKQIHKDGVYNLGETRNCLMFLVKKNKIYKIKNSTGAWFRHCCHKDEEDDYLVSTDVEEETKEFYPLVSNIDIFSPIQEIKEEKYNDEKEDPYSIIPTTPKTTSSDDLESAVYNFLTKNKRKSYGPIGIECGIKSYYNLPKNSLTLIKSILRELHQKQLILCTYTSDKSSRLYKAKDKKKEHLETVTFLKEKCRMMESISISPNTRYLILGKVQSGKTSQQISIAYHSYLQGISTVIVVLGTNESESQLRLRFKQNYNDYTVHMSEKGLTSIELPYEPLSSNDDAENLEDLLTSKTPGIIIVMCNSSRFKKLKKVIDDIDENSLCVKYNLIIDEFDAFVGSNAKSETIRLPLLEYLIDRAHTFIAITATMFEAVLPYNNNYFKPEHLRVLHPPDIYKGLQTLQYVELDDDIIEGNKVSNECIDSYFEDFCTQPQFVSPDSPPHPNILLYKSSRINERQLDIQDHFRRNFPGIVSIVYNGPGIFLGWKELYKYDTLSIPNYENTSSTKKSMIGNDRGDGILEFKDMGIKTILEWLRVGCLKQLNISPPSHIVIVSGDMAARGTSFTTPKNEWHLSHELFINSQTVTSGSCIQALRICGNYNDDIPLIFISTRRTWDSITLSDKIQTDIYDQAENISKDENYKSDYINNVYQSMSFNKEDVPSTKLANRKYHKPKIIKEEVDVSSSEDIGNEKEDVYLLHDQVGNQGFKRLYDKIVTYLEEYSGIWYPRSKIFKKISADKKEHQNFDGIIHIPRINHKNRTIVSDDTVPGMLMKWEDDVWKIRYNVD